MCCEMMNFPETPEEFFESYSFKDKDEIYTNGAELIPVFRVQQMIDHYFKKEKKQMKNTKPIVIKTKLDDGAFMPFKANPSDAGYDLATPGGFNISCGEHVTVDTGVHMLIPDGYYGRVTSRSGLNKKGIHVEGTVDAGYTGPIKVTMYMDDSEPIFDERPYLESGEVYNVAFSKGDRIAQIVIEKLPDTRLKLTDGDFEDTERGDNGFGSSGR